MLTLSQLLVLSQNDKRKFKSNYKIDTLEVKADLDSESNPFIKVSAVIAGGEVPRKCTIKLFSDEITAGAPSEVTCSCKYFKIRLALSLYRVGSTELKVQSRDIPEKFASVQKPGLCPHLFTLAEGILASRNTEVTRAQEQSSSVSVNQRLRNLT